MALFPDSGTLKFIFCARHPTPYHAANHERACDAVAVLEKQDVGNLVLLEPSQEAKRRCDFLPGDVRFAAKRTEEGDAAASSQQDEDRLTQAGQVLRRCSARNGTTPHCGLSRLRSYTASISSVKLFEIKIGKIHVTFRQYVYR
jgi:hypothetical protein